MNYGISILFRAIPLLMALFVSATEPLCSTWGRTRTDSLRAPWSSL